MSDTGTILFLFRESGIYWGAKRPTRLPRMRLVMSGTILFLFRESGIYWGAKRFEANKTAEDEVSDAR
jgi:hypothetical protein